MTSRRLSNQQGSGSIDFVKDAYPVFYNAAGKPRSDTPEPHPWIGGDWKHANIHLQRGFALPSSFDSSSRDVVSDYESAFYDDTHPEYKQVFFFRVLKQITGTPQPVFFRVEFELMGRYDKVETKIGPLNGIATYKCEDLHNFEAEVLTGDGRENISNDEFYVEAKQEYIDGEKSEIGNVFFQPRIILRAEELILEDGDPTPPTTDTSWPYGGWLVESRNNTRPSRYRATVYETDVDDQAESYDKLGVLGTFEFTLITYLQVADFNEGGETGRRFKQMYAMINMTPGEFTHPVKHEFCVPVNHDEPIAS